MLSASEAFLPHLGQARDRIESLPGLEVRLTEIVQAARRAWPAIALADEVFLRHLAIKVAAETDPKEALTTLFTADLFLACACVAGIDAAVLAFETQYMPRAVAFFDRNGSLLPHRDELSQMLRTRLLVGEGDRSPSIAEYSGRAPFGAWFRVVVTRFAIDFSRTHKIEDSLGGAELLASRDPDPELALLRTHHARDLDAAFKEVLAALPPHTATLLRLYYLDGVSAEAIARLNHVGPRTVQRWLAGVRARILRDTQTRLGDKLGMSGSQVGSLLVLMQSQMDLSICRFLEKDEEA
jgi:RNA polymerase sigma-70 factor (ECF subfamily)